jgi:hypothetical protein
MNAGSSNGCAFNGGMSQVYLEDSTTPNYQLTSATIIGVTFQQFKRTSINIMATETLTLTLMDNVWTSIVSDFIDRQQRSSDGTFPARVDVVIANINVCTFSKDGDVVRC